MSGRFEFHNKSACFIGLTLEQLFTGLSLSSKLCYDCENENYKTAQKYCVHKGG
ncbi:hypothetical protein M23134_07929 [Microscilla marina ATCC 23134]|uniref:Uncharacterized protein n=1 Tax=Microscilla marina ATCC 23134 TaxID=313606 RepID=A1ZLS8_MICM2|nr:hypothetical protein M23134_07929 [Microscilla marina ATCC 23134]